MRLLVVIAAVSAALLLSGCSTETVPDLVASTVPRDSQPGFIDDPQADSDMIDDADVTGGVDPASIRHQGTWAGLEIYLAIAGENDIRILLHDPDDPESWSTAGTNGNSELAMSPTGDAFLQYVPQGTSEVPEGWSALSDWVAVRD